ncbi:MAG TPA: TonB-dependent receptor [Bacteroidales bacterium]|nr:TonB-dependent receptor [Bacteroidales bacterium]
MKKTILLFAFAIICSFGFSQAKMLIKGQVFGIENSENLPLPGANVYWIDNMEGTITDEHGYFEIEKSFKNSRLAISYTGFVSDTISVFNSEIQKIVLQNAIELNEVEVMFRAKTTSIDFRNTLKVDKISSKEILKAACCNLSESFETNPSIDVSFTDAVTGTKQIQLLGLAGAYTQITRENMPDIRGLSSIYGLQFIPGAWIESILLSKGTGSVLNGFESIAGQINVNLWQPQNMPKFYLNLYSSESGRMEGNANIRVKLNDDWSTALLLHTKSSNAKHDKNKDGFLDEPMGNNYIFVNRWNYSSSDGIHFEFGGKVTFLENKGGQTTYHFDLKPEDNTAWGMNLDTKRYEAWLKLGKVNPNKPYQSFGYQFSTSLHQQKSFFGPTLFNAEQHSVYSNLIYQSIISSTDHVFKTGISFQYDKYIENLNLNNYNRTEIVPGSFFEYAYHGSTNFSLVGGVRADYHNLFGLFFTPRLHTRFVLKENTVLRASIGRGQRTANIIAENSGILASSRNFIIQGEPNEFPYGLKPEIAWNYGLNLTHDFTLDYRDGNISLEFYRTNFESQIVVDLDKNTQEVWFYNLNGQSFSNSFQTQIDYELINRLDVRVAYRWFDVKTNYSSGLLQKPMVSKHRAFINLAYETKNHWKMDYTLNWQGKKRIPSTLSNPAEFQMAPFSPDFFLMNAQISKVWNEKLDIYLGAENLLNYTQSNPILSAENPQSDYFDASLIWGPIYGLKIYLGLRYTFR